MKRSFFLFFFLLFFPVLSFASLPLDEQPFSSSNSYSYFIDDSGELSYTISDFVSPLSLSVYAKNYVPISGTGDIFKFGQFRTSFCDSGSLFDLPYYVPLSYRRSFSFGGSFSVDSFVNWSFSDFASNLNLHARPYPSFSAFSKGKFTSWSDDSYLKYFDPPVYSTWSHHNILPFGFDSYHSFGYSDSNDWCFWYGLTSPSVFSTLSTNDYYYGNWDCLISARNSVINFTLDMGDNLSDFSIGLDCSKPINFTDPYISALSTGFSSYSFGLTLSDDSLSSLKRSVFVFFDTDSYLPWGDTSKFVYNSDRFFDTPIDPLNFSFEYDAGFYYYLVQLDSSGSPLPSSTYGPFLFNTSYDLSLIPDISSDYMVSLSVFFQDVSVSLTDFDCLSIHTSDGTGSVIPRSFSSSSSTNFTSFGFNGSLYALIYNLDGFSFIPTIFVDGSSLDDINSSLSDLNDNLSSGFITTREYLGSKIDKVNENLDTIDHTIKQSTDSVNSMLDYVQKQVSQSIHDGVNDITKGWNDKEAQNLLTAYDRISGDLDRSVGNIFDILNSSLDQSGWKMPSWSDFISLFTSFSFVNFGLTSLYVLLGGAAVFGLILSFYFALKALWAIIHRGN